MYGFAGHAENLDFFLCPLNTCSERTLWPSPPPLFPAAAGTTYTVASLSPHPQNTYSPEHHLLLPRLRLRHIKVPFFSQPGTPQS